MLFDYNHVFLYDNDSNISNIFIWYSWAFNHRALIQAVTKSIKSNTIVQLGPMTSTNVHIYAEAMGNRQSAKAGLLMQNCLQWRGGGQHQCMKLRLSGCSDQKEDFNT